MKYGHVAGTKQVSRTSQSWYNTIAEENIARIEAEDAERALVTALATQVGNAVSALPEAASRIAKAATMVQHKDVWPLTTSGSYLVGSQGTQDAYLVHRGPWHCECPDHTHRGVTCKHILAVQLTIKLGATYEPSYN